ncbi:MAG: DUF3794 domain-containing protein [Clostridia bacterium]
MSFGFNDIKSDCIKKLLSQEVAVETFISDAESGGASKVLSVLADGKLMSLEQMSDEARVSGRVNFKIVYLDSEGALKGLDYFADFTENVPIDTLSGKLFGKIVVIDTDTALNGGIKLSAVVEITLFSVCSKEVKCLVTASDEFYAERGKLTTQNYVCNVGGTFSIDDDYDTKRDISKILLFDITSCVSDVNAGMGNVLVNGMVVANVTYLSNENVFSTPFNIKFSEELEKAELCMGQLISGESIIKSSRVVLTGVEGSNVIRVEAEVEIQLRVYAENQCEMVTDIFSVDSELVEKFDNFICDEYNGMKYFSDKLTGAVSLSPDMSAVREVVSVLAGRNTVAQAVSGSGSIDIEGVMTASILYRDENGLNSAEVEIPYSFPFADESATPTQALSAYGAVLSMTAKTKRDREIEVSADVSFKVEKFGRRESRYIAEITEGETKESSKSAVSLYIAEEGETMWTAAKALSARPDVLREQNPELSEPFNSGDKIIFYRQINFEF